MTQSRTRMDWKTVMKRAREADQAWILAANAVPTRFRGVVNNAEVAAVRAEDGVLQAQLGLRSKDEQGRVIADLYVRFVYHDGAERDRPTGKPSEFRRLPVSPRQKESIKGYIEREGLTYSDLLRSVVEKYGRYGTDYNPPDTDLTDSVRSTIPTSLWDKATARAEKDGFPLTEVLRHEILKRVRKRS